MLVRNKKRTDNSFLQKDEYLSIIKSFGIPTASTDLVDADVILQHKLIYNISLGKLRIFDGTIWSDASPTDLTKFYTKTEINLLFSNVNTELTRIGNLVLEANQATSEIYLKDGNGLLLSTLSVGFLNNEGTKFVYNSTTNSLDLLDDNDILLTSVPISSFVSNIASQIGFNNTNPYKLELKDSSNVILSTVDVTINNVQGLQIALNSKEPSFDILPTTKGGFGINIFTEDNFYIGGPLNTLIAKTPAEILTLINAQAAIVIGDGITQIGNLIKLVAASNQRIIINTNNIDLAQTPVGAGTYTKVTVDDYGRVVSATQITPIDLNNILDSISNLTSKGLITKITDNGNVIARLLEGTTGRIVVTNNDGVNGNPKIDLAPTTVIPGTYNGFQVDDYGRILSATQLNSYVEEFPFYINFPITGVINKIYIDSNTNKIYKWKISILDYVEISADTVISNIDWSNIINKPTTLIGYGIIDALSINSYKQENLIGVIDGINKIFTTSVPFIYNSISVYLNGIKEKNFVIDSPTKIIMDTAPKNTGFTDKLETIYLTL